MLKRRHSDQRYRKSVKGRLAQRRYRSQPHVKERRRRSDRIRYAIKRHHRKSVRTKHLFDLVGKKVGRLSVLKLLPETRRQERCWECICECGNTVVVVTSQLTKRLCPTRSCGCLRVKDISGQRFGKWTVISRDASRHRGVFWCCVCECGTKRSLNNRMLRNGASSCGCIFRNVFRNAGDKFRCCLCRLPKTREEFSKCLVHGKYVKSLCKKCHTERVNTKRRANATARRLMGLFYATEQLKQNTNGQPGTSHAEHAG